MSPPMPCVLLLKLLRKSNAQIVCTTNHTLIEQYAEVARGLDLSSGGSRTLGERDASAVIAPPYAGNAFSL
jgi:hypothetical protein